MRPHFLDARLPARFWSKVQPCPMTGCWIWTGAHLNSGYGSFGVVTGNEIRDTYQPLLARVEQDTARHIAAWIERSAMFGVANYHVARIVDDIRANAWRPTTSGGGK